MLGPLVAAAGDPTGPWVSLSVAGVAITTVGLLARRFLRSNDDQYKALVKPAYERVKALETDNARLERKLELAIYLLRSNGVDATEVLK